MLERVTQSEPINYVVPWQRGVMGSRGTDTLQQTCHGPFSFTWSLESG